MGHLPLCWLAGLLLAASAVAATSPSAAVPGRCLEPIEPGRCRAYIKRWAYSQEKKKCIHFGWGGCQPNGNNFASKAACKSACRPTPAPVPRCALPADPGPCKALIRRWYWDASEGRCRRFAWGGCGGNANRFKRPHGCEAACKPTQTGPVVDPVGPAQTGPVVEPVGPSVCQLPPEPGMCMAYFPSWYWSAEEGKCKEFIYGGCQGNGNRFESKAACQQLCGKA